MPASTIDTLELVHGLRKVQKGRRASGELWKWGRTQGFKHIKSVMATACTRLPKGSREAWGSPVMGAGQTARGLAFPVDQRRGLGQGGFTVIPPGVGFEGTSAWRASCATHRKRYVHSAHRFYIISASRLGHEEGADESG